MHDMIKKTNKMLQEREGDCNLSSQINIHTI
jgi:hypothetical protein